jgi:hypothetical protein
MRFLTFGFFSLNGTPGSPDSCSKAVLNIDLNWRSKFDSIRRHGAGKITFDRFFDRLLL